MNRLRTCISILAIGASTLLGTAHDQNLLTNGSFEAGTAGWTVVEGVPGACRFDAVTHPGNSTGAGNFPSQPPTNGANVLVSDEVLISTCTLFQDIVVPTDFTTLTYAAGYNYADLGGDPTGAGCSGLVGVSDALGNPIVFGFQASGGTNIAMAPRPALLVNAPAGSTIRVAIQNQACLGGPAGIIADNFVAAAFTGGTTAPTMSQWGMILLSLLLLGAAIPAIRARTRR